MNRVFRGALFPILIVIVLAFFVTKLIPTGPAGPAAPTFQTLTEQLNSRRGGSQRWRQDLRATR